MYVLCKTRQLESKLEIQRARRILKAKILEGKYEGENLTNSQDEGGFKLKI